MLQLTDSVFTYELTNGSFIIDDAGAKSVSVFNNSAVDGSLIGSIYYNGIASTALTIEADQSITIEASENSVLVGITITAPASCTLQIILLL